MCSWEIVRAAWLGPRNVVVVEVVVVVLWPGCWPVVHRGFEDIERLLSSRS